MTKFECLSLCEPLLRSLKAVEHHHATPIQQQVIPQVLKGRDLVGCAQTGTGKTAAFALPMLQQLMTPVNTRASGRRGRSTGRAIRALILAPTRELAQQLGESVTTYGRFTELRCAVVFGGVRQVSQVRALKAGVDILVATPGRLLDLIGQGFIELASVEILVLDEADRMLDMGFIHDLRKIVADVPDRRQTLLFSATMPKEIRELAKQWLRRPCNVQVAPIASTPDRVAQAVCFVEKHEKAATLIRLLREKAHSKTLVFSRTKRGADKIARNLQRGGIRAVAIHGDKSQAQRQAAIREFDSKRPPVLVATDLASRGLDFTNVVSVINYDLPDDPEAYVHRIGRTARAGALGQAVSFCGREERQRLKVIERLTGQPLVVKPFALLSDTQGPGDVTSPTELRASVAADDSATDDSKQGASRAKKHRPPKPPARRDSSRQGPSNSSSGSRRRKPRRQGDTRPAKRPAGSRR